MVTRDKIGTPLYNTANPPPRLPAKGNAGLWYDKFCNQWKNGWQLEAGDKLKWIEEVSRVGDSSLLEEKWQRTIRLFEALGGKICYFRTRGRFVTGLGRDNPVENGFAWHYNLGVPYLPGSSVKGLVKAWADTMADNDEVDREVVERVFGSDQKEKGVGSVIFFPALPQGQVTLEADVMTPHYGPYYKGENELPADWHSPVPIPFLTVAGEQVFGFPLAPRRPAAQGDLERAAQWLEEALDWLGAGAKTAVGYGRFRRDRALEERVIKEQRERIAAAKRERELAARAPLGREMEEDGFSTDPDRFMEAMSTKWLPRLDDEGLAPEEGREIAAFLAQWYKENRLGQWKKPKGEKAKRRVGIIKKFLGENKSWHDCRG